MPPLDHQILEILVEQGPVHVVEIASELDEHPIAVDRQCYSLQQNGAIRQVGGGVFTLTDSGKRIISCEE